MPILVGRVRGRELKKNRDGTADKILLQVELTSPDDIQTVEWINHDGEDSSPPDNSLVVVVAVSESYKIAIACDDGILAESQPGEKILYSQLNGVKRTSIILSPDGSVIIDTKDISGTQQSKIELTNGGDININSLGNINLNGSGDFAVRFLGLQAVVESLVIALNNHTHLNVTTGNDVSGAPETPFVINLAPALISNIGVPGL